MGTDPATVENTTTEIDTAIGKMDLGKVVIIAEIHIELPIAALGM